MPPLMRLPAIRRWGQLQLVIRTSGIGRGRPQPCATQGDATGRGRQPRACAIGAAVGPGGLFGRSTCQWLAVVGRPCLDRPVTLATILSNARLALGRRRNAAADDANRTQRHRSTRLCPWLTAVG